MTWFSFNDLRFNDCGTSPKNGQIAEASTRCPG